MRSHHLAAFGVGFLFAIGLALGGMTLPSKVIGFFDFSAGLQSWDPSLGLVMGGATLVYFPVYRFFDRNRAPVFAERFLLPTTTTIDGRLVFGAVLFGVGWGLGGFCPGPALTSLGAASTEAGVLVVSMAAGMWIYQFIEGRLWLREQLAQQEEGQVA